MTIVYNEGFSKYQVQQPWRWQLQARVTILKNFDNGYHWATTDGIIGAYVGCGWDGATGFPDYDWIMEASLGHDILHWLIADGVIPESQNNRIDQELENIILARAPIPRFGGMTLLKYHARKVRRATNLVSEKRHQRKPLKIIGRNVINRKR